MWSCKVNDHQQNPGTVSGVTNEHTQLVPAAHKLSQAWALRSPPWRHGASNWNTESSQPRSEPWDSCAATVWSDQSIASKRRHNIAAPNWWSRSFHIIICWLLPWINIFIMRISKMCRRLACWSASTQKQICHQADHPPIHNYCEGLVLSAFSNLEIVRFQRCRSCS